MKKYRILCVILIISLLAGSMSACGRATTKKSTSPSSSPLKSSPNTSGTVVTPPAVVTASPSTRVEPSVVLPSASVTASNKVSVNGLQLNYTQLHLDVGSNAVLSASVSPSDATNKDIIWESGNKSVASVVMGSGSDSATLTGVAAGSVIVTATSSDGSKVAACIVMVGSSANATKAVLDTTYVILAPGETRQLNATVVPTSGNSKFKWSASDTNIAKVSSDGLITAVNDGTATITVISTNGGQAATCTVLVKKSKISVTGVSLSTRTISLKVGESGSLSATIRPDNADIKTVTWLSGNKSVATVDGNGNIKAIGKGTTTITVTTTDGGFAAICTVTVGDDALAVSGVLLIPSSVFIGINETQQLVATVTPSTAKDKSVIWSSSDSTTVSVSSNGQIMGRKKGTAVITVTTNDGSFKSTCSVTVS